MDGKNLALDAVLMDGADNGFIRPIYSIGNPDEISLRLSKYTKKMFRLIVLDGEKPLSDLCRIGVKNSFDMADSPFGNKWKSQENQNIPPTSSLISFPQREAPRSSMNSPW